MAYSPNGLRPGSSAATATTEPGGLVPQAKPLRRPIRAGRLGLAILLDFEGISSPETILLPAIAK